jgi:spoIIIJ-associated protein
MFNVSGDDLGVLIGPRGETLDALQYVARLMVAHRLHRRTHFLVDVEGYRERREQALARLAERMADKVRQRHEPISLEPMPPYERRIIHMTLRNAPGVYTESTGEGDRRKVRIYPQ